MCGGGGGGTTDASGTVVPTRACHTLGLFQKKVRDKLLTISDKFHMGIETLVLQATP